jgi:hypothetical protein
MQATRLGRKQPWKQNLISLGVEFLFLSLLFLFPSFFFFPFLFPFFPADSMKKMPRTTFSRRERERLAGLE